LLSIDNCLIVSSKATASLETLHNLEVLSLLLRTLHQNLLHLTLDCDGLCNDFGILLLCLCGSLKGIGICLSLDFGSLGLGVGDDSGLNKIGLGGDLTELDLGLSIHLVNKGDSLFPHLSGHSLGSCTNLLNLLLLGGLLEFSLLGLVLSLLESLLLKILKGLVIVLDAELIGLLLALKGVLELENCLLLEGVCDVVRELDMGDDH
jgi:hypothetical protein